jgi:hypothetical protein
LRQKENFSSIIAAKCINLNLAGQAGFKALGSNTLSAGLKLSAVFKIEKWVGFISYSLIDKYVSAHTHSA